VSGPIIEKSSTHDPYNHVRNKAWCMIHQHTDRTFFALKKADTYGQEKRGDKRSDDGNLKQATLRTF